MWVSTQATMSSFVIIKFFRSFSRQYYLPNYHWSQKKLPDQVIWIITVFIAIVNNYFPSMIYKNRCRMICDPLIVNPDLQSINLSMGKQFCPNSHLFVNYKSSAKITIFWFRPPDYLFLSNISSVTVLYHLILAPFDVQKIYLLQHLFRYCEQSMAKSVSNFVEVCIFRKFV